MVQSEHLLRIPILPVLLLIMLVSSDAHAVSVPEAEPPACAEVDGQLQGMCPSEHSDLVSGTYEGRIGASQPSNITTVPALPKCNRWQGQDGTLNNSWSPSPCYAGVDSIDIGACWVIDLHDGGTLKRMSCPDALYRNSNATSGSQLFTKWRSNSTESSPTGCGASFSLSGFGYTDYTHWYYDGGQHWAGVGSEMLTCALKLKTRPDGMYGPTWVEVYVGVTVTETGCCNNTGIIGWGEHPGTSIFVPIDGDMRDVVDVAVTATGSVSELNWEAGRVFATYKAKVANLGDADAQNVELAARFPDAAMVQSISGAECTLPGGIANPAPSTPFKSGGTVICKWPSLAAHGAADIEIVARITDATDLAALQQGVKLENFYQNPAGVEFKVKAGDDMDLTNNEALATVDIAFRNGSYAETNAAMAVLEPYFDYTTDTHFKTCNFYMADIYDRLEAIRAEYPDVFAGLSYGRVTSGQYKVVGMNAGHVGVVVYPKGTDYRQVGIIINGTPSNSPLAFTSEIGPDDPGGGFGVLGWTGLNGYYLRTAANKFPGTPHQQGMNSVGFEGRYPDNAVEFTYGGTQPEVFAEPEPESCPLAPDAVTINTESPVEIIATNSRGEQVETKDGLIVTQGLGSGIYSMAFPHEDGTYAWTLVLPVDDYEVKLVGTRTGPYKLTLTTFDADGNPVDEVTEGHTTLGQVDDFTIEAAESTPGTPTTPSTPTTPETPGGNQASGRHGGGGAFDPWLLLGLATLVTGSRLRKRRACGT